MGRSAVGSDIDCAYPFEDTIKSGRSVGPGGRPRPPVGIQSSARTGGGRHGRQGVGDPVRRHSPGQLQIGESHRCQQAFVEGFARRFRVEGRRQRHAQPLSSLPDETAASIAESAGASAMTVSRFLRSLGFTGCGFSRRSSQPSRTDRRRQGEIRLLEPRGPVFAQNFRDAYRPR